MPTQQFILNGKKVKVDVEDDVRLLWVLRDILHVTGPKYGCGLDVCKACTSHISGTLNGKKYEGAAFNPCSLPVGDLNPDVKITTIEGLPGTVGKGGTAPGDLHPMQEAWLEYDVAQCGYCQPGQIMAAVASVQKAFAEGRRVVAGQDFLTDDDFQKLRNICRCGSYIRIREATNAGAAKMTPMPHSAPMG